MALTEFHLRGEEGHRDALCRWLETLDVDPAWVAAGRIERGDKGYELHVVEMARDGTADTTERVVQLGDHQDWPIADGPSA